MKHNWTTTLLAGALGIFAFVVTAASNGTLPLPHMDPVFTTFVDGLVAAFGVAFLKSYSE